VIFLQVYDGEEEDILIPTPETTLEILKKYQVPPHILQHSEMVRRVALAIAACLKKAGLVIDSDAVDRASLLHDLCKMDALQSGKDHALMAQEELSRLGHPFIGEIVGQHVRLKTLDINEAMVVNYADKRVMHDRIVSLAERFEDLMARYGTNEARKERIRTHYKDILKVEAIIAPYCRGLEIFSESGLVSGDQPLDG
jgi:uncharacterized protein